MVYLKQLHSAHQGRGVVKSKLDDIGQHDLQIFDASLELVVIIMPPVTVHIQDAVVKRLQAFDELLEGTLQTQAPKL